MFIFKLAYHVYEYQLYKRFPNRPLEFQLATNKAPSFKISPGSIHGMLNVRANVVVNKADGSKLPVFYLDIVSHTNRIFLPRYLIIWEIGSFEYQNVQKCLKEIFFIKNSFIFCIE